MKRKELSRRGFVRAGIGAAIGAATGPLTLGTLGCRPAEAKPVVSIARVRNDNVGYAVEEAIDLLGGIATATQGRERIMLKPNLVAESPDFTTKPEVIETLARVMQRAGKEVLIGEGSAAASGFNVQNGEAYRTTNREILDGMQQFVFDRLGYSELARSIGVPLINLHSGDMVDVQVPDAFVYDNIMLHRSLADIDLLCSVPMMKTHVLATVTLGMKNLIGLYPGTVYCSVRACVHDHAATAGSPGVAFEIVDMVRANKVGLTVIDGTMAMEGDGPTGGSLVKMDLIVAGTDPLATDMVAAQLMGFETAEVPTFTTAHRVGMTPTSIDEIEIRGARLTEVRRALQKPNIVSWTDINQVWGVKEMV
ncbi:MAG: hypothetical protein AMS25_09150 [Gemmatimonas sp. SM23_52]|nr:MAG: hypothetical protein AMS25_09150 [Gemmatimonas sp. SM23_52]